MLRSLFSSRLRISAPALLATATVFGTGCLGSAPSAEQPADPDPSQPDPIAGIIDDCHVTVSRGLYFLGLKTSGRDGSFWSYFDSDPRRGGPGYYPLSLSVSQDPQRFSHFSSAVAAPVDPRCAMIDEMFYLDELSATDSAPLDLVRYPAGRAVISVSVDLWFDNVAFAQAPNQVAVPFVPATDTKIPVAMQTVQPTRMSLEVSYGHPIDAGTTRIVETQKIPLDFACETPYPLEISWQPLPDASGPLCAANHAGATYCLVYEVRHGGGDCRFAIRDHTPTTVRGAEATVDLAGSLTSIVEQSRNVGMNLEIDRIELR
jgi:hypothetical protein